MTPIKIKLGKRQLVTARTTVCLEWTLRWCGGSDRTVTATEEAKRGAGESNRHGSALQ